MNTGSIQSAPRGGVYWKENHALEKPFVNGHTEKLINGQEVYLMANGSVGLRNAADQVPIGYISVGNAPGEMVTVSSNLHATVFGAAKGGAIEPGTELVPDGTVDSNGLLGYAAATAGDLVSGVALSNAASAGDELHVGLLRYAYKK